MPSAAVRRSQSGRQLWADGLLGVRSCLNHRRRERHRHECSRQAEENQTSKKIGFHRMSPIPSVKRRNSKGRGLMVLRSPRTLIETVQFAAPVGYKVEFLLKLIRFHWLR